MIVEMIVWALLVVGLSLLFTRSMWAVEGPARLGRKSAQSLKLAYRRFKNRSKADIELDEEDSEPVEWQAGNDG